MNLKALSNDEVISKTKAEIKSERDSTAKIIRLFQEISRRRLYLEFGFPSLFEMATKEFGYCAASAMRRINAVKLVREIPMAFSKIESGELSLSVVNELQTYFQQELKEKRPHSQGAKVELIEFSLNKSRRDVEREIARRNPERAKRESIHAVSEDRVRMSISVSNELLEKMNELRDLRAHANPTMTVEELLEELVELGLEKYNPARKSQRKERRDSRAKQPVFEESGINSIDGSDKDIEIEMAMEMEMGGHSKAMPITAETGSNLDSEPSSKLSSKLTSELLSKRPSEPKLPDEHNSFPPAEVKRTRYIPVSERPEREPCCYIDLKSGRRCNSTKFLQLDHITPYAEGGGNERRNLRWMCAEHNRARSAVR